MYAKRMNKIHEISTPQEKQAYLERGFDIYDDDDDLLEASPQKTVAYSEYIKLRAASEAMRKELYLLRSENEQLKLQLETLVNGATMSPASLDSDTPAADPTPPDLPQSAATEEAIKTLHPADESAPKMGGRKK